jgi:formate dehydrogenase major subunit/formate dehydrogenase alpha subunit
MAGIYIPALCADPDLEPTGDCRLCLVEIEGMPGLVTACTTFSTEGMVIHTGTPQVNEARRAALQPILAEHPIECLICDRRERCKPFDICLRNVSVTERCVVCPKNTNCELQRAVDCIGITELPPHRKTKPRPVDDSNPFFRIDRNYCVLCKKCVRACNEVTGVIAIEITRTGDREQVSPVNSTTLLESICKSCGECMVRCPVGALIPKETRQPEQEVKTTCPYCGVGCQMYLGIRDEQVIRVSGDRDNEVNVGRLCVKGRFGIAEFIHHPERLTRPLVRQNREFTETTWDKALDEVATKLGRYQPDEVAIISSAKCTNEENYVIQKLGRAVLGTHNIDHCARL